MRLNKKLEANGVIKWFKLKINLSKVKFAQDIN